MLDPKIVQTVKRMLAEGKLSQRAIARRLKGRISRGSINAIASGKRPDYEARRMRRLVQEGPGTNGQRPPVRCGCGALVYLPCRACLVRKLLTELGRLLEPCVGPDGDGHVLELQLRPADQARYEKERAAKEAKEKGQGGSELQYDFDPRFNQDVWDDPQFDSTMTEERLAALVNGQ